MQCGWSDIVRRVTFSASFLHRCATQWNKSVHFCLSEVESIPFEHLYVFSIRGFREASLRRLIAAAHGGAHYPCARLCTKLCRILCTYPR